MRCPKCGYENPNDSNFCISCGTKLEKQEDNTKVCKNCGATNYIDSAFCTVCGSKLENEIVEEKHQENNTYNQNAKPKASPLNKATLILSIIGASITIVAISEEIALVGLTLSAITLVMIAIGLLTKKITGSIKFNVGLSVFGVIGNMLWLFYLIWMLPKF